MVLYYTFHQTEIKFRNCFHILKLVNFTRRYQTRRILKSPYEYSYKLIAKCLLCALDCDSTAYRREKQVGMSGVAGECADYTASF